MSGIEIYWLGFICGGSCTLAIIAFGHVIIKKLKG